MPAREEANLMNQPHRRITQTLTDLQHATAGAGGEAAVADVAVRRADVEAFDAFALRGPVSTVPMQHARRYALGWARSSEAEDLCAVCGRPIDPGGPRERVHPSADGTRVWHVAAGPEVYGADSQGPRPVHRNVDCEIRFFTAFLATGPALIGGGGART